MPNAKSSSSEFADPALDAAFCESYRLLVSWCRRHVWRGLGDAEEFVHQAYLRSRNCWSSDRRSAEHTQAYFFRSLRWVVADAARKRVREQLGLEHYPRSRAGAAAPIRDLVARESLERDLTIAERTVCLGLMAGRSEVQLVRELRISRGALAVRASRARQKLLHSLNVGKRKPRQ